MLRRRELWNLGAIGEHLRDEPLALRNALDLDGDALDRALDALEARGDVGGHRRRRRAAALQTPSPRAHEWKEHHAGYAEHDRDDHHVLGHGVLPRDSVARGGAAADASPRSASSLVRKRWFSDMRSTSRAIASIPRSMRSMRSPVSGGALRNLDWFSILRAHARTSTSIELPMKMVPSSAPTSSGAIAIIPPLSCCLRGR